MQRDCATCYISLLAAYAAEGRLLLAPAAFGGARSIRYTACLELATVVPRALARCRFSKSHHRPAQANARSSCSHFNGPVRPCRSSTAYFVEIGNFYTLRVEIFQMLFLSVHVYLWTMKRFMEIGPHVFQKSGRQTHRRTDRRGRFI